MKLTIFFFIGLIVLTGCASFTDQGLKSRSIEDYYTPTGVEKYFLTDIPEWAQFNQAAQCHHISSMRYLDLNALMKSYGIDYGQSLQIQASFNEEYTILKNADSKRVISLRDEELLFYKVSEKVSSKIIFFDPPTFKRINLIWLDEVVGDKNKEKKLISFLSSKTMDEGPPVLLSFCLKRDEIEKLFPELNAKILSAELFSVFNSKGDRTTGFKIELDKFFSASQKIYFYSQKKEMNTQDLLGLYKTLNY